MDRDGVTIPFDPGANVFLQLRLFMVRRATWTDEERSV